ncbi:quinone-dependent dihydroorotate dehydrogenase [Marinoscillum sp. 108]|uniref:quinone-dependent dihydroorotate dehydrogenase n=1 Tax=Marinoscillum sp. 108 TaxID=2653151 RepID=UPI0012F18901|nr:quinone-dependent dihydroorotate dehydrogenase [Marinoscillum sp. 108]VXD16646.1 Dihydroorotate dehydrogenase (quinone) [Marinoscillum sp. 108]
MYQLAKKFLFSMPAEKAHHFTTKTMRASFKIPLVKAIFKSIYQLEHHKLERKLFGLTFKNPVGLAAGFDKNAEFIHEFAAMGFGFIEIGTVTPLAQPGNPEPRLFRLPGDHALINRMGFNNKGMHAAKENLQRKPKGIIIGGNIGKNKVTPNEQATDDYLKCFDVLYPEVDYFVVNVSSPNTPDLRKLQDKEPLEALLRSLQKANRKKPNQKPILLKIAPDLTNSQLDDIIEIAGNINLDGIIATNTTIDRSGLQESAENLESIGAGGLSGAPVFKRSTEIIQYLRAQNRDIPIIAVGGILSGADALEKLAAGANLVQVYTGLVYKGPALIKEINQAILANA